MKEVFKFFESVAEVFLIPLIFVCSLISLIIPKKIDVGMGPQPLINNVYHKMCMEMAGYSCETFVTSTYFITKEFDHNFSEKLFYKFKVFRLLMNTHCFLHLIFRYKIVYFYFNGGPLNNATNLLKYFEAAFLKVAKIKIVIMPYGGDVQALQLCPNKTFVNSVCQDYPHFKSFNSKILRNLSQWTLKADYIISGCDWVDYTPHWDKLMLGHFSIDLNKWKVKNRLENTTFKVLHAPNHTNIKGTQFFIDAVEKLQNEGEDIELILVEGKSNEVIRELMNDVDLVLDQLIIGWYAMFSIEAMSMEKPVICYLRDDLKELYINSGIVKEGEIPIINCTINKVYDQIKWAMHNRPKLKEIGTASRIFVEKHHSLEAISKHFKEINEKIGLKTNGVTQKS